jgi:hypothetical protein
METIRYILIILHVNITICMVYNYYHHLVLTVDPVDHKKHTHDIIAYIDELVRVSLYHTACIIVVWYRRRYRAGIIRATGVLLIGELIQVITLGIQHALQTHDINKVDVCVNVIGLSLLLTSVVLTFRLATNVLQRQQDSMQTELIDTSGSETVIGVHSKLSYV